MPKSWEELNVVLHPEVLNGIKSFNFPYLTPVQAYTIPQLLNKKDVAAEAVTGNFLNFIRVLKVLLQYHYIKFYMYHLKALVKHLHS